MADANHDLIAKIEAEKPELTERGLAALRDANELGRQLTELRKSMGMEVGDLAARSGLIVDEIERVDAGDDPEFHLCHL